MVSNAKYSIYFCPNTGVSVREDICGELNILTQSLSNTYLGLPTMVGVDKSDCFEHLIDRVCQRLKGWKEKVLSMQGKEFLLNLWRKQYLRMLCQFSNYPKVFARP